MLIMRIHPSTTVEVSNHRNLLAAWRDYGRDGLVGRFIVTKPLTKPQLSRLPRALKELL